MEGFLGFLIIIGAVVAYFYYNSKIVECPSCKWKGSRGRWRKANGCPNCHTDLRPVVIQ